MTYTEDGAAHVLVVDRTHGRDAARAADQSGRPEAAHGGEDTAKGGARDADVVISNSPTGMGLVVEGYTDSAVLKAVLELALQGRLFISAVSQQSRQSLLATLLEANMDLVEPAALRQARRQAGLIARLLATPVYTYETLAEVHSDASPGATRTWVSRARAQGHVFTVTHNRRTLLPAFQFDDAGNVRDDIASLIEPLSDAGMGGMQMWAWLVHPTPLLSGLVPAEAVANPETATRARRAAERMAARIPPATKPSSSDGATAEQGRTRKRSTKKTATRAATARNSGKTGNTGKNPRRPTAKTAASTRRAG